MKKTALKREYSPAEGTSGHEIVNGRRDFSWPAGTGIYRLTAASRRDASLRRSNSYARPLSPPSSQPLRLPGSPPLPVPGEGMAKVAHHYIAKDDVAGLVGTYAPNATLRSAGGGVGFLYIHP